MSGAAAPDPFRCEVARDGARGCVRPVGELDLETVHLVEEQLSGLREAGVREMVLDLRGLTFMDSSGLRLVIRWDTAARSNGFDFALVPGPDAVQRVFDLTGMEEHLTFREPGPGLAA